VSSLVVAGLLSRLREPTFYAQVGTKVGGESHFDVRLVYARGTDLHMLSKCPRPDDITKGESLRFQLSSVHRGRDEVQKVGSGGGGSDAVSQVRSPSSLSSLNACAPTKFDFPDPLSKGGLLLNGVNTSPLNLRLRQRRRTLWVYLVAASAG